MISKYAELQDRALLYNACKGILRVKQASDTKPDFYIDNFKVLHDDPDFYMDWDFRDRDSSEYGIRRLREMLLNAKNDATSAKINAMSNASIANRISGTGKKLTSNLGLYGGGLIGGGLGLRAATALANHYKLLGKDKSLNRRRLGTTLQLLGMFGGGAAGAYGGHYLGRMAGDKLFDTTGLTYTSPDDVLKKSYRCLN